MVWTDRIPLDDVVLHALPAGTLLQRCYRIDRQPVTFWPSTEMRFAAAPRAMLYTGDSDTAAIAETLLRDPQARPGTRKVFVPLDHVQIRGIATLRLRRDASYVDLRRPAITAVIRDAAHTADVRALIEATDDYAITERFARALLQQVPAMNALAWPSRRADGHAVYCFYNDPFTEDDFELVDAVPFTSEEGMARLRVAVATTGLELEHDPPPTTPAEEDP